MNQLIWIVSFGFNENMVLTFERSQNDDQTKFCQLRGIFLTSVCTIVIKIFKQVRTCFGCYLYNLAND